ncbi:MAG: Uma2 family endonuclease [Caldilineaceae bacterium]
MLNDLVAPYAVEEDDEVGSYNHSSIQANLAYLLKRLGNYKVLTELSLELNQLDLSKFKLNIKEEIKPDVCIYPKRGLSRPYDILKMSEMPLLAIEILSPKQSAYDILAKLEVYFALGVKSCWLVDPAIEVVAVYSALERYTTFSTGDVIDESIGIRLPLTEIFE